MTPVLITGLLMMLAFVAAWALVTTEAGKAFLDEFLSALRSMLALVVGDRAAEALCGSQAAKTATPASRRELETSSFEAYTHCGGCGKLDYHPMREPRPEMTDEEFLRAWKLDYCLQFSIPVGRRGVAAWLEHTFDVIRECSCGHSWGQR